MKRLLSALVVLTCGLLLSSCALLQQFVPSGIFDSDGQTADARMEQIADALNSHDDAALKDMFSPFALERATGFDDGLEYLLSFFPNGGVTWERDTVNSDGHNQYGKRSTLLLAYYKVTADGEDYWLFFADFIVNEVENPANVGIYGLGVTPWTEDGRSGAAGAFNTWSGSIHLTSDGEYGYPGIYVPRDDVVYPDEQVDGRMGQIAAAVNSQDAAALKALFSTRALEGATAFDERLVSLLTIFPEGEITWERLTVNSTGDDARKVIKLLTTQYRVSAGGEDYWLFFADFVVDAKDPENVGLASLAVTPWFEPGADPDPDPTFSDWGTSWISEGEGPTGIYVPTG